MQLRAQLDLPRRVPHARDAGKVPRVEEVQRSRQVERRGIRNVERFGADFELPLSAHFELLRDAEIQLSQWRSGDVTARSAERAEIGVRLRVEQRWIHRAVLGEVVNDHVHELDLIRCQRFAA